MSRAALYVGDALEVLRTLPDESVQCCVTSPPYWGLRDYGQRLGTLVRGSWDDFQIPRKRIRRANWTLRLRARAGRRGGVESRDGHACVACLGLEPTPEMYAKNLVNVLREVRRALSADGTLWLNLGDSYNSVGHKKSSSGYGTTGLAGGVAQEHHPLRRENSAPGLKHKDLVGIPWRVAFALQADGWWLRSDIVWHKPNPMPESVTDRPTRAHEYLFLLSKSARYFYDASAIRTTAKWPDGPNSPESIKSPHGQGFARRADKQRGHGRRHAGFNDRWDAMPRSEQIAKGANARSVWSIATVPYPNAHFATFPPELAERCIKAGSRPGDTVLDPFGGSGTTASVATGLGRNAIHIDLNPEYLDLAIDQIGPLLVDVKEVAA